MRNSIHEKVSELRNLIYTIKDNLHEKISENAQLQNEVNEMKKSKEHAGRRTTSDIYVQHTGIKHHRG